MNKICTKCSEPKLLKEFYYHRQRKQYMESCKKCNNKICTDYAIKKRKECDPNFIFMSRAAQIKRLAKIRGTPVMEGLGKHLFALWIECKGRCYYTGRELHIDGKYHTDPNAATVDRLIPALGYVEGNVVLASGLANRVKQNLSITELFALIDEIRAFRPGGK